MRERSECEILDHAPVSNAARAAFTARLMSSLSPSAMFDSTSPVAGLYVGKVLPLAESTHLPLISILWVLPTYPLTFGSIWTTEVAVAIS